jgi:hypothetical protein
MSERADMDGRVRSTVPADGAARADDDRRRDVALALLRLLVGGTALGADQLRDRMTRWQETALTPTPSPPPRSAPDALRYALVGMLFETESRMRQEVATMFERLARLSDDATILYTRLTLTMLGTPVDPLVRRFDEMTSRAMARVDRWIARGRVEEQRSRHMTQHTAVGVIDELLDYMAHNPEVRHLIEQQGLDMADTAVDEMRERAASADAWIERLAHSLFHRAAHDRTGKPSATVGAAPLTGEAQSPPPPAATRMQVRVPGTPARTSVDTTAEPDMPPHGAATT